VGIDESFDALVARSYAGLKQLAGVVLREQRDAADLAGGPSSVVNEAVGRLAAQESRPVNEEQLRGLMTVAMRRVLADRRRRREAVKRGGGWSPEAIRESALGLVESVGSGVRRREDASRVQQAVAELLHREPRRGEVLLLSAQSGLSTAQIAEIVGIGVATVERDLRFARAWVAAWLEDAGEAA
jgi:RNA polymerase sigma factor (TIGR02999 family)